MTLFFRSLLFFLVPTGIKDLMLYPLGPTAVVLSWTRPYLGVFRKYVVEMFYFNPTTMTSEWTTYYEIAATVSLSASVVILPESAVTCTKCVWKKVVCVCKLRSFCKYKQIACYLQSARLFLLLFLSFLGRENFVWH